jgi:hypothetical protein
MQRLAKFWRCLVEFADTPSAQKLGRLLGGVWVTWGCTGFIGMFFTGSHPAIKPFVWWTLVITLAGPLVAMSLGLGCCSIVYAGVAAAGMLYALFEPAGDEKWERRLVMVWSGIGGALLSLLFVAALALTIFGPIADVKLWFILVCWLVLMIPWAAIGLIGRWTFRYYGRANNLEQNEE